jgi:hypothetical protein
MNENKESMVDALFDIGETWASHGLRVAESSLQASARTLTAVSKFLGNLAEELKRDQPKDVIDVEARGA